MKKIFLYCVTICLLVVLLAACGLIGSKGNVIKCKGTQTFTSYDENISPFKEGSDFKIHALGVFTSESDCPELIGQWELTENISPETYSGGYNYTNWGIFRIVTAYQGGGVFEGIYHGEMKSSVLNAELTSYNATGSLKGLQLSLRSIDYQAGATSVAFEATIQNAPTK